MKKIILAAILAGIGSSAAWAADVAAPVQPVPVQVYNWTGFYVGADAGFAGVKQNTTSNFSQQSTNPDINNNVLSNPFASTPFAGGGHAGFNWQFAPNLVAGVEGDWQSVRSSQSLCRETDFVSGDGCLNTSRGIASASSELNWVATARARLGWVTGPMMLYATGGAAFAEVKSSVSLNCPTIEGCGIDFENPLSASANSTTHKTGWVAGAGIEWMFAQNWILRGEYQHIDLGSVTTTLTPDCHGCSFSATQKLGVDVLRAGVSFKFGG